MASFIDETIPASSSGNTNASSSSNVYTVQEGDTLTEILQDNYGNGTTEYAAEFAKNNGIENPDLIYVGQEIKLDKQDTASNTTSKNTTTTTAATATNNENGDIILDSSEEKELLDETNLDTPDPDTTSNTTESTLTDEKPQVDSNNTTSTTQSTVTDSKTSTEANTTSPAMNIKDTTSSNKETVSRPAPSSTNYMNTPAVYTSSTYMICYPASVKGWTPLNSFRTFQVKANAGEEFVAVDQCIKKCSNDIDGIVTALKKLKTTMGDNTGTTTQIDKIVAGLNEKKQDLITKEKELIQACEQVVQYIYENKSSKTREASLVAETISKIQI